MVVNNIDKLAEDLERQELEAPTGVASPQVYSQLLAIYLYQNDLCNAKFLWKRVPASVKSANPEIGQIWTVGQHLWKSDFPATYKALNAVNWSDTVAEIMKNVQIGAECVPHQRCKANNFLAYAKSLLFKACQVEVRSRAIDLISQAYSSITLDAVLAMTGLTPDVCVKVCLEKGWLMELDTKMVYPTRKPPSPVTQPSSEDQLYKLTDFVSFLEN